MPALRYWGMRWSVGGDEFVFPAMCSVVLRGVWCAILVVILVEVEGELQGCSDGWYVYTYLACSIATLALAAAVEWAIAAVSTQGEITDTVPRSKLGRYLNLHVLLALTQLLMAAVGTFVLTQFHSVCSGALQGRALDVLVGIVAASQYLDVMLTLCCCFTAAGIARPDDDAPLEPRYEAFTPEESRKRWASRCRWCCSALSCCTCRLFGGGGQDADFEHLARIMDRIFHTQDYLDVVPSDIAAGIVLLRHLQRERERRLLDHMLTQRHANANATGPPYLREGSANFESARSDSVSVNAASAALRYSLESESSARPPSSSPLLRSSVVAPPPLPHDEFPGPGPGAARRSGTNAGDRNGGGGEESVEGNAEDRWPPLQKLPLWMSRRSREHLKWHRVAQRHVLDINSSTEREALKEVCHFARYALAVYTWYLYVFDKPLCGCCELCVLSTLGCSRCFHRRRRRQFAARGGGGADPQVLVAGDNFCSVHETALLRVAGLNPNCELVFASFHNDFFETPYAIFVDHEWESVVIAVRGTMSLDDCITDVLAEPKSMAETGRKWGFNGEGMLAHYGTLSRAEWLRQDIEKRGILRALLAGGDVRSATAVADQRDPEAQAGAEAAARAMESGVLSPLARYCRNYRLRVVGHSLGAGVAVLLGYMLRGTGNQPEEGDNDGLKSGGRNSAAKSSSSAQGGASYGDVRCVALSPPGGLLDEAHARECGTWVVAAVLGNDLVPRLGVECLENMRDQVFELIGRAKVNKLTVMRSTFSHRPRDLSQLLRGDRDPPPSTRYQAQLARYMVWAEERRRARADDVKLVLPGKIIHFVKTHKKKGWPFGERQYTPVWADNAEFDEMTISPSMFVDHFPTRSIPAMQRTLHDMTRELREEGALSGASLNGERRSSSLAMEAPRSKGGP